MVAVVGIVAWALTSGQGSLDTGDKIGSVVSALLGVASLGIAVAALRAARPQIDNSLVASFASTAADARLLVGTWHHYHLTSANGRYEWRHLVLRLAVDQGSTAVRGQVHISNETGRQLAYAVEAGIRGSAAVLMFTSEEGGPDAAAMEVYPELRKGYTDRHCGIAPYETWNRTAIVGKSILSKAEQVPARWDGSIEESGFAILERRWQEGFADRFRILPSAIEEGTTQLSREGDH